VPKSRVRKKKDDIYTPPPLAAKARRKQSPRWLGPLIVALWLLGATYLVVGYLTNMDLPVMRSLQNWNILIGFGLVSLGFGLATKWQ
jgi:hypothetical protein